MYSKINLSTTVGRPCAFLCAAGADHRLSLWLENPVADQHFPVTTRRWCLCKLRLSQF
jgi:hypothetical protein